MEKKKQNKRTISISPEIICQRKFELIKRDPLAIELDELARGKRKTNITYRELHKRFPHYDYIEIQEQGLTGILEKELIRKWNISAYPTGKLDKNIPFSWLGVYPAHPTVSDARIYINDYLIPAIKEDIEIKRAGNADEQGILHGIGAYDAGFPNRVYIPIPKGIIPILIDIGGLSDRRDVVTKQVWNIVKEAIKKRRVKKSEQLSRIGDSSELRFIYTADDAGFKKHLRWYDMHTTEHLSFRDIARKCLLEIIKEKIPDKAKVIEAKIKDYKTLNKNAQKYLISQIGSNIKIDWEDAVEKAVRNIKKAIHRESKKEYDITYCPIHGNWENCPEGCNKKIFDQRHRPLMLKKRRFSKDPDSIPDPNGEQPPAKSKQRKMMDLQKYLTEEDE